MDSSDSHESSNSETYGEKPVNPYDLSKAIAASVDITNYFSESARSFVGFGLHGPTPVMFHHYKYPLRISDTINLAEMRSSLNSFITRKSREEARVNFYNNEARRQVQQAAANADAEVENRNTIRKHIELYSMESSATELHNFMLTSAQRVRRELDAYRLIQSTESNREASSVLQTMKRISLEICYASLLRANISSKYQTILLDKLLANIALHVSAMGDLSSTSYFTLENAATCKFVRQNFIDSETGAENVGLPVEGDNSANAVDKKDENDAAEPVSAHSSVDQSILSMKHTLMTSHHSTCQSFTEYIERLINYFGEYPLLSDLGSFYDVLSMYTIEGIHDKASSNASSGKIQETGVTAPLKKGSQSGISKASEKTVAPVEDLTSTEIPNSAASSFPLGDLVSMYQRYNSGSILYDPEVTLLGYNTDDSKRAPYALVDFEGFIKDKVINSTSSTRCSSAKYTSKMTPCNTSPASAKKSPREMSSAKKKEKVHASVVVPPDDHNKELEMECFLPSSIGYLDYNELFSAFKHVYHFYQFYVLPSRDIKLLRCKAMDPLFSISEYVRSLANNPPNGLSQFNISEASLYIELSTLLADSPTEGVDLLDDLLCPDLAGAPQTSSLPTKSKSPVDKPKSRSTTPVASRLDFSSYSKNTASIISTLNIKLRSVGDFVNYLRFLCTFLADSYEVRARKALIEEIQDMVFLSLCKADNNVSCIREYLLNRDAYCASNVMLSDKLQRLAAPEGSPDIPIPPAPSSNFQGKHAPTSQDDNYFTSLLTNLDNTVYIKELIDKIDMIFITGDPVSGKTLMAMELSKRLTRERKISTGIVDACTIYRSLYEELMRMLDHRTKEAVSHEVECPPTVYSEEELMTELLTLHNKFLYIQLANANTNTGERFYPHPLHNAKSLSDGLILNSNSIAGSVGTLPDASGSSVEVRFPLEDRRVPGRSSLRDELPVDTDTLCSQDVSLTATEKTDSTAMDHSILRPAALLPNVSAGSLLPTAADTYRDVSLFSQQESEAIEDVSDDNPQPGVRFNLSQNAQTLLHTPKQYLMLYKALQRKVRQCLLSRTGPSLPQAANDNPSLKSADVSSELQEIEQVNGHPNSSNLSTILAGLDMHAYDTLTVDVGDSRQVSRFLIRSILVQAITQSLLSNHACLIFDGFPNSLNDLDDIEDMLNGCLTRESLERLLTSYSLQQAKTYHSDTDTNFSFVPISSTNPLSPVFMKRSGMTSLIFLHDENFEDICRRLYGRLFISSHPVESDDIFNLCCDNYQLYQEMSQNSPDSLQTNGTRWLSRATVGSSTYVDDQELSMTDDGENPKKKYLLNNNDDFLSEKEKNDSTSSSNSGFSSSYSTNYSSDEEATDPECERVRKRFPISPEISEQHKHSHPHQNSSEDILLTVVGEQKTSRSILYNSHHLNISINNFAAYNTGLKVPAHEIRDVGFMHSATLDVLSRDPVKDVVLFGDDYVQSPPHPVEIPLHPVQQKAELPTRNASKANLSLLSIYTNNSVGFVPWIDEKSDDQSPSPNEAFIKSYPIVDPQAYDAFCKAISRSGMRISSGCQNKNHNGGTFSGEAQLRPSVTEVYFAHMFFDLYSPYFQGGEQKVALHRHEVVRNLIQLNYENRLLINRVNIELASYKYKRDVMLSQLRSLYGSLQPRMLLPLCIQLDNLFQCAQHANRGMEPLTDHNFAPSFSTLTESDSLPSPSVLYVCSTASLFSKPISVFAESLAGSAFEEEFMDISNKVYHHVLRAMDCRHRSINTASYELGNVILGECKHPSDLAPRVCDARSFAIEFLTLYHKEMGIKESEVKYLNHLIPEPVSDNLDPKKSKAAASTKTSSVSKAKASVQEVTYAAPNLFVTFNLPSKFFSNTVADVLKHIVQASDQYKLLIRQSVGKLVILETAIADVLTHEYEGQLNLLTGFYDVSTQHTHSTFTEFVNFYRQINKDSRGQPNIKADALLLIERCLLQCNDNIFKTKARSDALINGLTSQYLRLSARISPDVYSLPSYNDIMTRYLPQTTKDREVGIALGVFVIQYISSFYNVLWADLAYVAFIFFSMHELSLSAYNASNSILYDLLNALSTSPELENLAEVYTTGLDGLLAGKVITPAMIDQQISLLKATGKQQAPVLIVGTASLLEHIQQKNQKPYEGYASSLDSFYPLAKSLTGPLNGYQTLLQKIKEQAAGSTGSGGVLTVEEYAHCNLQAFQTSLDLLHDLAQTGILVSQNSGSNIARVPLHNAHKQFITNLISKLDNKLLFAKTQIQAHIAMCTDGLSDVLLKVNEIVENFYAASLSMAASAARTMQTVVDKEIDILSFDIDVAERRILLEVDE